MKKKLAFVASIILVASFLMGSVPPDGRMGDSPNPLYSNKAIIANAETGESYELPVVTHWARALGEG